MCRGRGAQKEIGAGVDKDWNALLVSDRSDGPDPLRLGGYRMQPHAIDHPALKIDPHSPGADDFAGVFGKRSRGGGIAAFEIHKGQGLKQWRRYAR